MEGRAPSPVVWIAGRVMTVSRAICTSAKAPVTFARGRGAIKETGGGGGRWWWRSLVRSGGHQERQPPPRGKRELASRRISHLSHAVWGMTSLKQE